LICTNIHHFAVVMVMYGLLGDPELPLRLVLGQSQSVKTIGYLYLLLQVW